MLIAIFLWILFAFFVAAGARNRGRSGFGWFLLACIFSPILAGLILLILGSKRFPYYRT